MSSRDLPRATPYETAAVLALAAGPLLAKGVIVRRPAVVRLLQATNAEARGVRVLQSLRARHGDGPVMLRVPGRDFAVALGPPVVRRVLAETPEPFETDLLEKHVTLAHFEPRGSLASRGEDRAERRAFNDRVLDSRARVHALADAFAPAADREAALLLDCADRTGRLEWGAFKDAWHCMARSVVLGPSARDDKPLDRLLIRLRGQANWAFLSPVRPRQRARFQAQVQAYLDRAEPGSLAALVPANATARAAPVDQFAQYLFAFDAAGIATFRALLVLSSLPGHAQRARDEAEAGAPELPYLRAAILESVRLWPTTPAILRETDRPIDWNGATLPQGAGVLIHVPYLHRDERRLPYAHRFAPEIWLSGESADAPLIPFSGGPGFCPAKNLVLMLGSRMLAALLRRRWTVPERRRVEQGRMPATLDQFSAALGVG